MRGHMAAATHYCRVCQAHFCDKCTESHANLWDKKYLIEIGIKGEKKIAQAD